MDPDEFVRVVQIRHGPVYVPRLLIVRRAPRICVPQPGAVLAGLRLVLGLEAS